jgi:NAD(P)-dependent dehydrogenase (short-subunit alcohol dehydrogenase family)
LPESERVWLITGAGRGLGRAFTEEAVRQGGKVVAAVRSEPARRELSAAYGDAVLAGFCWARWRRTPHRRSTGLG